MPHFRSVIFGLMTCVSGVVFANPEGIRNYCFARAGAQEAAWPFVTLQRIFDKELMLKINSCIDEVARDIDLRETYSNYNATISDKAYRQSLGIGAGPISKLLPDFERSESFQVMGNQSREPSNHVEHEALEGYSIVRTN